jgi:hypothetical protein
MHHWCKYGTVAPLGLGKNTVSAILARVSEQITRLFRGKIHFFPASLGLKNGG